jgi:hypothetical protein
MSTIPPSDAWSINVMRQFLIHNAKTAVERVWAESIPWQALPTSDMVAGLLQCVRELEDKVTRGLWATQEKAETNERLFADYKRLQIEAERVRAENEQLLAENRRLFADNADLHRGLCCSRAENDRLARCLNGY